MLANIGFPGLFMVLLILAIPAWIIYRVVKSNRARSHRDQQFKEQVLNRIDSLEQQNKK